MKGRRHLLLDVLVIAVLAALCGIDDWEGTVYFARGREDWLHTFLAWVGEIREKIPEDVIAFDGKTLRASLCQGKPPLHVVSKEEAF